ncbi:MAG: crossover junction endodeoxyribonuclease RuvC [Bacteroidota bacterium]|nr:crossover junction endodeoxyribonuclease RuvC [Bacteroidota bacterium]
MAKKERIILGVDPGTNVMGYGLIKITGNHIELISLGVLKLAKLSNHALKLKRIFERVLSLVDEYNPDEMALEAPFHGKNVQSMLKLGRAQGVAMAAGLYRNVAITEYAPRKIKQSITGKGAASKEQVASMVQKLLNFKEEPKYLDATDALAVALCHYFQGDKVEGADSGNYSGWASFVSNNPGRVK